MFSRRPSLQAAKRPRFAKRMFHLGQPACGGLGKPQSSRSSLTREARALYAHVPESPKRKSKLFRPEIILSVDRPGLRGVRPFHFPNLSLRYCAKTRRKLSSASGVLNRRTTLGAPASISAGASSPETPGAGDSAMPTQSGCSSSSPHSPATISPPTKSTNTCWLSESKWIGIFSLGRTFALSRRRWRRACACNHSGGIFNHGRTESHSGGWLKCVLLGVTKSRFILLPSAFGSSTTRLRLQRKVHQSNTN